MHLPKLTHTFIYCAAFFLNLTIVNGQTKSALEKITEDLEKVYASDQSTRKELNEAQRVHGYGSKEFHDKLNVMNSQDSINRNITFKILDEFGWLTKSVVSERASRAFFYTIQHADLDTQIKYKHYIDQAFKNDEISNYEYAIFEDRINVRLGKNQLYGTQSGVDNIGNSYLYPCGNIDSVHARRAKMGIQELSLQLKNSNTKYHFPNGNNPEYEITIIGHFWDKSNKGKSSISLWHDGVLLAESDLNGFLFIKYGFLDKDVINLTLKNQDKILGQLQLEKGKDFYELYFNIKD